MNFPSLPGTPVRADTRVGQEFEGAAQIYNRDWYQVFIVVSGENGADIDGTVGDRPAITQAAPEGLATLVAVTNSSRLTYTEFEKFEEFLEHKAATWAIEEHRARDLPETGFVEAFSRHAKSLVAVGNGAGADRALGLETEIVALKNPYTDDVTDGLPVEVLYQGAPRAGEQVEVFERAPGGEVTITLLTTDAAGQATIPVKPGHAYMLDSVVLRAPGEALQLSMGAVWESLWANLTFAVPD